jgi:single-stranded-DNA-specific exonuclease
MGNPAPMMVTRGVRLASAPRVVGSSGLKLRVEGGPDGPMDAIGWSLGPRIAEVDMSRPLDLAYRIERDEYQGVSRLQLRIADFRHS